MKVTFNVDNGANIYSCKSSTFDLNKKSDAKAFGFTKEEWLGLSDSEKDEACHEWANQHLEIYWEEQPLEGGDEN